jgi:F-type H+-transporting ATPase subunit a
MAHFNWTQLIPGVGHHYVHVATAALVTLLLIIFSLLAYRAYKKNPNFDPADKFSIKALAEVLTEFVSGLVDTVVGSHGKKYVPMFGAIFLYILCNNLMGLVPGMTPATDNFNTTLAVGVFTFVAYTLLGIKEHGAAYIKQFTGHLPLNLSPILLLLPLMFIIELISHAVRPMSLGLRLRGNMVGDHTVLGIFTDLVPIGVPVIFYMLGIFVCFIQAFVFTLLSMVYVSMATAHDDHH